MRRAALTAAAAGVLALAACDEAAERDIGEEPQEPDDAAPDGDAPADEDIFEPDEPAAEEAPPEIEQPDWAEPPTNEIGAPMALEPVVFEGEEAAVAVTGVTAHSTGAELHVAVRFHPDAADDEEPGAQPGDDPLGMQAGAPDAEDGQVPDDQLRLAVAYPDGRAAATTDVPHEAGDPDAELDQPQLSVRHSMGTPNAWDYSLWLWPRPEPGDEPLEVVAEWPEQGIDTTSAELDMDEVSAAADRVVELWP